MNRKIIHFPIIFIIGCTAYFVVMINGCLTTHQTHYGLVGRPAISSDGKFVTVLVAESQGSTYQENGGFRNTVYNTAYWLKLYETATGKFIRKKKIVADAEKSNMLALCFGGYHDKIWLHTNEITAYDIISLEEVANQEKLAKQSGFDVYNFPDDQRFIIDMVHDGYIRFTAINGDKYRINLASLVLQSEKGIPENDTEKINEQLRVLKFGNITYGVRTDTMAGKMYILAKDSSTAMDSRPGNGDDKPVYRRMYFFTADYSFDDLAHRRFYRYNNMQKLAGPSYLNAIFLKDFATNKLVHVKQPGSYIILHNDSLHNNANSMLTATDKTNNTIWQINTGLSTKLSNCVVNNKYCILTGYKNYLTGPHIGSDMLCIVDMETGRMITPSITE